MKTKVKKPPWLPPVLLKDVFSEIWTTKGRFFSIMLIVALGVAFFGGIKASAPDMKASADLHFDNSETQDIQVYSTLGITKEDIKAIAGIDGVEDVQGQNTLDALMKLENSEQVVKVISWNDWQTINQPRLVEGRLPEEEDECLLEASTAVNEMFGTLAVGDTISLYSGTDTPLDDDLSVTRFRIVGTAYNPNYLSYEKGSSSIGSGSVDTFVYVMGSVFKADYYTEADVLIDGSRKLDTYSDEYFDLVEPIVKKISRLGEDQIDSRMQAMQAELETKKKEADEQLAAAQEKLDAAKVQLDQGQSQLDASKIQLDSGKLQLDNGQDQLADAAGQIADGLSEITKNEKTLLSSKEELDAGWKAYEDGVKAVQDGLKQVDEGLLQIAGASGQLETLKAQQKQLNTAKTTLQALQSARGVLEKLLDTRNKLQEQLDQAMESLQPGIENPDLEQTIDSIRSSLKEVETQIRNLADSLGLSDPTDQLMGALDQQIATITSQAGDLQTIESNLTKLNDGIAQIEDAMSKKAQLEETRETLRDTQKQLDDSYKTLERAQAQYDAGAGKLDNAKQQIADAQKEYEQGQKELDSSQVQYDDGLSQYEDGQKALDENRQKYEDGLREYNKQKADAEKQIADAEKQIKDLKGKWIVLDRNSHYSYRDYQSCAERMDGIASVFPVFFFLVAALVCMTTMTRMVAEQRTEIGTLKALGYSKGQIAFKYMAYAGLASVIGCILGTLIGMVIFPWIIFYAWNTMYNLETLKLLFPIGLILQASLSVIAIVLAATFFSIWRELLEVPSQLMRPKAGKAGKKILLERIPWLWKHVSFMHKVTLRNLFRDKKRFLMTIVGISGCSALLVAGFGLNDSISDIVPRQFGEIYHFDATVSADGDAAEIKEELQNTDGIKDVYDLQVLPVVVNFDSKDITGYLNILDDVQTYEEFMTFIPAAGGHEMNLDDEGVFISIATADKMGLHQGDTIHFKTTSDQELSAKVTGIFDQYIDHQIYVTKALYDTWGVDETPSNSFLLVNDSTKEDFEADLGTRIMALEGVKGVTFYSSLAQNFLDMISAIKSVVIVLVLSAAMLAFVVLYNLSNVNISERMREIATIKVLGFTEREVNQYINRETLILSAIGAFLGLFLGIYLHGMIMNLAELDTVRFGRTIAPLSFGISFVLTMVFTFAINWIMKFKLRQIQMVESLKAVE